jgi:hypothetical protein
MRSLLSIQTQRRAGSSMRLYDGSILVEQTTRCYFKGMEFNCCVLSEQASR